MIVNGTRRGDKLAGGYRADTLYGLDGNDTLSGNAGNDRLDGGAGADYMRGGIGNDVYVVDNLGDRVQENPAEGYDEVRSTVSFVLPVDVEALVLLGGGAVNGTGNTASNVVTGNAGNNILAGGGGNDTLSGGTGNDTLIGGAGADKLTGGSGADIFRLNAASESARGAGSRDVILDFEVNKDHVDLTAWNTGTPFTFINGAAFSRSGSPEVRISSQDGNTILQMDAAIEGRLADGVADAEIQFAGAVGLTLQDIIGAVAARPPAAEPGTPPAAGGSAPPGAIIVSVGDDLQAMVDGAGVGASFWLEAGIHRLQSVTPKDGQSFFGAPDAIMNGARLLTGFSHEGSNWVASGQTQQGVRNAEGHSMPGMPLASNPDALFINDKPLQQVASLGQLEAGKYYFDYGADKIYFRDDPTGKKVEAAVSPFAFAGEASDVTVHGLTIEKYAVPIQFGAIFAVPGSNWTVENNEVRLNYGVGIVVADGGKILNNFVHDNGEMGLGGHGQDLLVEGNEISNNGYWSGYDVLWEGGGTKFAVTENLIVKNNYSHDNNGFGFWTDIDNIETLYENNRVENNRYGGINHEISYDVTIRGNSFAGNGAAEGPWLSGSAIRLQNSQGADIYNNTIDMTTGGNGIGLIQDDRGAGAFGPYLTRDNNIHNNIIISRDEGGAIGGFAGFNEEQMLDANNIFDYNQYRMTSGLDDHWAWGDYYDWETFRDVSGQEAHGQLVLL